MMRVSIYFRFFQYLQDELAVPRASIENAIESVGADFNLLPIELWQCQVITIQQLDQAYEWLALAHSDHDARRSLL